MNQPLTNIGTKELVSLPDFGITDVLAKIDTGADSSAIWASNITERDGELSFTLFGPGSPNYTAEEIKTHKYSLVTVKNSFGQKEARFKVSLKIRIAERNIKVRITLANRANNRFPILIGRRTLKGKFLVDVSKVNSLTLNSRVLFLVAKRSETNRKFVEFIKEEGIDLKLTTYDDLVFYCGGDGNRIVIAETNEDISVYGLTYFRTSKVYGHLYVSASIAQYLYNRNLDFIDRTVIQTPSPDKLFEYVTLADKGLKIPATIFMLPTRMEKSYEMIVANLGLPFILKDTQGSKGNNNYLINTKNEFDRAMFQAKELGVWLMAQKYIPNDSDYRLLVIGGQVVVVIKRSRQDETTHLNNISQGAKAEFIDPSTFSSSQLSLFN